MSYIIYEIVILVVLLAFAIWGLRRGLVMSLCSLLAVLVALVGAVIISNSLTPAVAGWIQPSIEKTVVTATEKMIGAAAEDAVQSALPEEAEQTDLTVDTLRQMLEESNLSKDDLLQMLEEVNLPPAVKESAADLLEELPELNAGLMVEDMSEALSEKLANGIARVGLLLLSFVLILVLWGVLARALNLVARLPVLRTANKLGGFVFGGLRGALLLFVCAWALRWIGNDLIPAEAVEQTKLLNFFMTVNPLDYLAKL